MARALVEGMTHRALTIVPPAYTRVEDTDHARELLQEEICRLLRAAGVKPMRRRNVPMYALEMQRRAILDGYLLPDARLFVLPDGVAVHQEPLQYRPSVPLVQAPVSPVSGEHAINQDALRTGLRSSAPPPRKSGHAPKVPALEPAPAPSVKRPSSPPLNEGPAPRAVARTPRYAKARTKWAACS
jgi:hypothetical protein